jgi:hypothetical protein
LHDPGTERNRERSQEVEEPYEFAIVFTLLEGGK